MRLLCACFVGAVSVAGAGTGIAIEGFCQIYPIRAPKPEAPAFFAICIEITICCIYPYLLVR